jgi:transcriptional regulator NrdR family protein
MCQECLHRFNTVEITMDEYDHVLAIGEQKQQLMERARVFSEIVQGIVDIIPDRKPVKKF